MAIVPTSSRQCSAKTSHRDARRLAALRRCWGRDLRSSYRKIVGPNSKVFPPPGRAIGNSGPSKRFRLAPDDFRK